MHRDFEAMKMLAFHRELVASRRLAHSQGLTLSIALVQILTAAAGQSGLLNLLQERRQHFAKLAEIKLKKKRQAEDKYAIKLACNKIPDSVWCGWFDGSARPNPGSCSIGALLQSPDGQRWEISRSIGYGNSSYAEYHALIALLELALKQQLNSMIVFGDSRVVIDDLQSGSQKYAQGLSELRQQANELMSQMPDLQLKWIPRARNQQADRLALQATQQTVI